MRAVEGQIRRWSESLRTCGALAAAGLTAVAGVGAEERTQTFDRDPGWDGHNNRSSVPEPRVIAQDFGYSATAHAGGAVPGEMGGLITPAAEPAYYARRIRPRTFDDAMSASGRIVCAGRQFHVLLGFFDAGKLNEWRTPNTAVLRLQGRGDIFFAYVEYATSRWRAGGDSPGGFSRVREPETGRMQLKGFPSGAVVHDWSLRYDPRGNGGTGSLIATVDGEQSICHLDPEHRADGAAFNRFGLMTVMKQADDAGEVWLDEITVDGERESFDREPAWEGVGNRRRYTTTVVRPRFDFGFSGTHFAGGRAPGEMGGLVYRGDGRFPEKMAYYGDRLDELTLEGPLRASGKISLRRGVSDSDILVGFFHSERSLASGGSDAIGVPPDFLGISIGGPSREGFMLIPAYRLANTERRSGTAGPHILPDGTAHEWSFEYRPGAGESNGILTVTLGGDRVELAVPREHRVIGGRFNRFGIISTHTDGNCQDIYFDDLRFTFRQ